VNLPKTIKLKTYILTILATLIISISSIGYILAQSSATFTISQGIYPGAPGYTIWREESVYYAKNAYGSLTSGTNFTTIINNALLSDNVYLKSGIYELNGVACNIKVPSNRVLEGEDKHTTLIRLIGNAYVGMVVNDGYIGWLGDGNENITVRNISFDGGGTDPNGPDGSINFKGITNLLIENVATYNSSNLSIDYIEIGLIRNILLNEHSGAIVGNRLGMGHTNYTTIENVRIYGSIGEGIYIDYCFNNTFINNYIEGCADSGLELRTSSGFNTVIGNTFVNNVNQIYLASHNNIISNNRIQGGTNAIVIDYGAKYNTISSNTIYGLSNSNGIMIQTAGTQYNAITANTLYDCGYGIRSQNTGNNTFLGNMIFSCNYGIELLSSPRNILISNIANNGVYGIWEYSSGTSDYNVIIGCAAIGNDVLNIGKIGANSQVNLSWNGTTWIA